MANFITENITNMNTKYTLKNFRVFDEQGATFELAPVTILTGCNSSGKSSVTKSLMLLKPLFSQYKKSILNETFGSAEGFSSFDLDFTRGKHNLGNFEKVINWNSTKKEFTISVEVYSVALRRPMTISFTFANDTAKRKEQTLHAKVRKVEISSEGQLFYYYEKTYSIKAFINLRDWKADIIKILHDYITTGIGQKEEVFGEHAVSEGDMERSLMASLINSYSMLLRVETLKKNKKNRPYRDKLDFPYGHIYTLGTLMDDLNSVSKADMLQYAENRFVNDESIKNAWYNDDEYKGWIHDMFVEYISSDFEKFSDFYSYYEGFKLSESYTNFGTITFKEHHDADIFIGLGTASPSKSAYRHICFPIYNEKNWSELTPTEKFYCIFYCLQGFGNYRTKYKENNFPEPLHIPQLEIVNQYAQFACEEILMNCDILTETEFIELDRSNVQRIYSFDTQGTSFNRVLDTYYNTQDTILYKNAVQDIEVKEYKKGTFATKWLMELTGFSGFSLKQAPEGAGYYVYLKKDKRLISLADVGYGVTPLISMLLRIEIAICKSIEKNFQEIVTICIEEPESNLHPSVQAKLADLFADAAKHYPVNFILETHSEYLVRRSQVIVAEQHYEGEEMLKEKCPFKVYYMPRPDEGKPYDLEYKLDGKFRKKFGKGFFDIADSLALELL